MPAIVGFKPTDVPPTAAVKFIGAGTAACIADLFTFPLDTALQIQGETKAPVNMKAAQYTGVFSTISTMVKTEGPKSLYNGLVAGLQRQMSFSSIRIGLYYSGEEGMLGLWKGATPNITRNAIVNCTELVTYDLIKDTLLKSNLMTDDLSCHFTAAFGAGFCTTVIASPVNVVKIRYMNSAMGQYKSSLNCALTMFKKKGPLAFYKGFMPSFLRLGSWNVVMFVTYERLKRAMISAKLS
ncbi:mitochondrial uncoupling protein 2-like [Bombina bombina]|uniref:mitochondrial uncoupling protein 2-like n=1 Tax=Bombina bombina TaxID=8345 RepID=UPI00235B22A3|nr:mitochondrial uncoupling protein 2-like [Bombina bombina]